MRALDEPLGDDRQEQESRVTSGQIIKETIARPHCLVTATAQQKNWKTAARMIQEQENMPCRKTLDKLFRAE